MKNFEKSQNFDETLKFQLKVRRFNKKKVRTEYFSVRSQFDLPFKEHSHMVIKWLKIEFLVDISTFYSSATRQFPRIIETSASQHQIFNFSSKIKLFSKFFIVRRLVGIGTQKLRCE